jgi:hypothetical protein
MEATRQGVPLNLCLGSHYWLIYLLIYNGIWFWWSNRMLDLRFPGVMSPKITSQECLWSTYVAVVFASLSCNMFHLTPSLYINLHSSSCISWFHSRSNVFNVWSYFVSKFDLFTQTDYSKEINGIVRQGAPLNLVLVNLSRTGYLVLMHRLAV